MAASKYDGKVILSTRWNQGGPYNNFVPWNFSAKRRSSTGCVTAAQAQVLYYWLNSEYGKDITISLTDKEAYYYNSTSGDLRYTIDASKENAEKFKYLPFDQVNAILEKRDYASTDYIAALNFTVGVWHWIDFDDYRGFASGMPSDWFYHDVGMRLANYDMWGDSTDWDESKQSWVITDPFYEVLIDNLLAGCPVVAVNYDHAYIIDGYNSANDTFHVNWGDGKSGTWRNRASLNSLGNEGFVYDIMPRGFDGMADLSLTVTDTDWYGSGTFLRILELANTTPGHDTITFDIAKNSRMNFDTYFGPYQSCLYQTYESLTIDSMSMIIEADRIVFTAPGSNNMSDEDILCLNVRNFSGTFIANNESYDGATFRADKLFLEMNSGALCSNFENNPSTPVLTVEDVESFRQNGFAALSKFNLYDYYYPYGIYSIDIVNGGQFADVVTLDDRSLILGNIDLGSGNNILSVRNGSLIGLAEEVNFGDDLTYLTIDSTSKIITRFLSGNVDMTCILGENFAEENAMISVGDGIRHVRSITIDATHAENGVYRLFDCYIYRKVWEDVVFIVKDKSGSYELKLGETAGNFSVYQPLEDGRLWLNYIEFKVSDYTHDKTAPVSPANWNLKSTVEKNCNSASVSWADASDDCLLDGYIVRYGKDAANLDSEKFFASTSGTLTGLTAGDYYYQVCAVDRSGNRSGWSTQNSFTVDITDTEAPEVVSPAVSISENDKTKWFDLDFSDKNGETGCSYRVKIGLSEKGCRASQLIYEADQWSEIFSSKDIGSVIYYSIQAIDRAGNVSEWSEVKSFTLEDKNAPDILSGVKTERKQDNVFTVTWDEAEDFSGVTYEFQFATKADFSDARNYTIENAGTRDFYLPVGEFYWRGRTVDGAGNASAWYSGGNTTVKNTYFSTLEGDDSQNGCEVYSDLLVKEGFATAGSLVFYDSNLTVTFEGDNAVGEVHAVYYVSALEGMLEYKYGDLTVNLNGGDFKGTSIESDGLTLNIADDVEDFVLNNNYGSCLYSGKDLTVNGDLSGVFQSTYKKSNGEWGGYTCISSKESLTVTGDISGIIQGNGGIRAKNISIGGEISGFVGGGISAESGDFVVTGIISGYMADEYSTDQIEAFLQDRKSLIAEETLLGKWYYVTGGLHTGGKVTVKDEGIISGRVTCTELVVNDNAYLCGEVVSYGDDYDNQLAITVSDSSRLFSNLHSDKLELTVDGNSSFCGTIHDRYGTAVDEQNIRLLLSENNLTNCSVDVKSSWMGSEYISFTVNADRLTGNGVYKLITGQSVNEMKSITLEVDGGSYILGTGKTVEVNCAKYSLARSGQELRLTVADLIRRDIVAESSEAVKATTLTVSPGNSDDNVSLQITLKSEDSVRFYNYSGQSYTVDDNSGKNTLNAGLTADLSKLVAAESDGAADVFFIRSSGLWGSFFSAVHSDLDLAPVALTGKNRITDIFVGAEDANILFLTDDSNGDALFGDDIYSDSYKENGSPSWASGAMRLKNLDEICAGAGDDVVDLSSNSFEYIGDSGLVIRGGDGNDVIWGTDKGSTLFGDAGNDLIAGGSGNDLIAGGSGDDELIGGGGDDRFCFAGDWGSDVVSQSGGTIELVIDGGDEQYWDAENRIYADGDNEIKVLGDCQVTCVYGFDDAITAAGVSASDSSGSIYDEDGKGFIAVL